MNKTNQTDTVKMNALEVIREVCDSFDIQIEKILFFGSRKRGDYTSDSDWDFLVVVDNDISFSQKHRLIIQIKRKLAKLKIPNDILIQSKEKFNSLKNYPGCISYAANLEGVVA
jgi:predicted nucleotidyltransferase